MHTAQHLQLPKPKLEIARLLWLSTVHALCGRTYCRQQGHREKVVTKVPCLRDSPRDTDRHRHSHRQTTSLSVSRSRSLHCSTATAATPAAASRLLGLDSLTPTPSRRCIALPSLVVSMASSISLRRSFPPSLPSPLSPTLRPPCPPSISLRARAFLPSVAPVLQHERHNESHVIKVTNPGGRGREIKFAICACVRVCE